MKVGNLRFELTETDSEKLTKISICEDVLLTIINIRLGRPSSTGVHTHVQDFCSRLNIYDQFTTKMHVCVRYFDNDLYFFCGKAAITNNIDAV